MIIETAQFMRSARIIYQKNLGGLKRFDVTKTLVKVKVKVDTSVKKLTWSIIMIPIWRCPWCKVYRRRKWTPGYEFKSWTRLIAFHIELIPLGKV